MNEQEVNGIYSPEDIENNKIVSALAYIIFFLPLIVCPDSPFGKFHANQGLMLFIVSVVGCTILSFIPIIGWIILPFYSLVIFIFAIMGIVGALNGKAKELPIIGKYKLLK